MPTRVTNQKKIIVLISYQILYQFHSTEIILRSNLEAERLLEE